MDLKYWQYPDSEPYERALEISVEINTPWGKEQVNRTLCPTCQRLGHQHRQTHGDRNDCKVVFIDNQGKTRGQCSCYCDAHK